MKKLFTGILLLIVFLSTSGTNVFAAQNDVQELVNEANQKIQALIVVAKQEAKEVMSNDSLTELEKEVLVQAIADQLVVETDTLAADAIANARALGYNVVCDYKEVKIGDLIILVDPLRVGGW